MDGGLIHPVAAAGFGADPERYERGRPGYPIDAVAAMLDFAGLSSGTMILDVAAGTGKLTRMLTAHHPVVALDPVGAMREFLARTTSAIGVVGGVAEALPFAPNTFPLVTVAQAFHWFDADLAWKEFARVVPAGGSVAIVWNARDRSVEWVDQVWSIMDRVERHAPWRNHDAATRFDSGGTFSRPVERTYWHSVPVSESSIIDRVTSVSHVAVLDEADRAALVDEIRLVLRGQGAEDLSIRYRTDLFLFRRR